MLDLGVEGASGTLVQGLGRRQAAGQVMAHAFLNDRPQQYRVDESGSDRFAIGQSLVGVVHGGE